MYNEYTARVCACRAGRANSIFKGLARSYQTLTATTYTIIIIIITHIQRGVVHVENADVIKSIPKFSAAAAHKTYYASNVIA
jgi:hypothetical protein